MTSVVGTAIQPDESLTKSKLSKAASAAECSFSIWKLRNFYLCLMAHYNNKVVVVTGGSEGIGKALVEQLLAEGAKVATCGRDHDKLYALQSSYPSSPLHTMVADVSNENDCRRFIETTIKFFGPIDVLINNAGISQRALFNDSSIEMLQKVMDINFWGTVYCTKYALPSIIETKGSIVGISSIAGYRGLPGRSGYSASKFALRGWLESIKTELMDDGVHVMWVSPGFTSSNIRQAALDKTGAAIGEGTMDEGKMMSSEECARHILKAVVKKKRTLILTFTGKQTVFLNKFFPRLTDKLIHNFYFKSGKLVK